jgi:hypothetical protein
MPWFPFAWIEDNGHTVSRDLPIAEFEIAIYVRNAIMRAMRHDPPSSWSRTVNFGGPR